MLAVCRQVLFVWSVGSKLPVDVPHHLGVVRTWDALAAILRRRQIGRYQFLCKAVKRFSLLRRKSLPRRIRRCAHVLNKPSAEPTGGTTYRRQSTPARRFHEYTPIYSHFRSFI